MDTGGRHDASYDSTSAIIKFSADCPVADLLEGPISAAAVPADLSSANASTVAPRIRLRNVADHPKKRPFTTACVPDTVRDPAPDTS